MGLSMCSRRVTEWLIESITVRSHAMMLSEKFSAYPVEGNEGESAFEEHNSKSDLFEMVDYDPPDAFRALGFEKQSGRIGTSGLVSFVRPFPEPWPKRRGSLGSHQNQQT